MPSFGTRQKEWIYSDGTIPWTSGSSQQQIVEIDEDDPGVTYGRAFVYTTWSNSSGIGAGSLSDLPTRFSSGLYVGPVFGSSIRPPLPNPDRWLQIRHGQIWRQMMPVWDGDSVEWRSRAAPLARFDDESEGQRTIQAPGDTLKLIVWASTAGMVATDIIEVVWAVRVLKFTGPPTT